MSWIFKTMIPRTTVKKPSNTAIISAAASVFATAMFLHSTWKDYIPHEARKYILQKLKTLIYCSKFTLVIEEYDKLNHNVLFEAAKLYLETIIPPDTQRLKIAMASKETEYSMFVEKNTEIVDTFNGVSLKWKFFSRKATEKFLAPSQCQSTTRSKPKSKLELSFHKKHKDMVLDVYLNHVIEKSKEKKQGKKKLKLYTLRGDRGFIGSKGQMWQSTNLDHPATFDTLAMETEEKNMIMEDLERFVSRKEFYRRVGKAWKRGYLLFGPPGTGKSSLIAAMANYLKFDIYDLELTEVRANSELIKLLLSTANKSILVVEDIDCSIALHNRHEKSTTTMNSAARSHPETNTDRATLSGLLNFIDGLWSSCGDERIIIFTTNHKEKIDPALLRPGRMDVHIHMSYCTPCGFKMLASNYLGITEHSLFSEIEELVSIIEVTPAEIAEQLMKDEDPETALRGLIGFLKHKKGGD